MFRDRQQELDWLQDQLLEEEEDVPETEEEQEEDYLSEETLNQLLGYKGSYYNTDAADVDLDAVSQELFDCEEPKLTGLLITAASLTFGIFLVLLWWILRYLGVL